MAPRFKASCDVPRPRTRARRPACVAAFLLAAAACGGPTATPSSTQALHGEVSDPVGDALADPRVPIPPDLVRVTADVVAGNLTFLIQVAPGTLDRQAT